MNFCLKVEPAKKMIFFSSETYQDSKKGADHEKSNISISAVVFLFVWLGAFDDTEVVPAYLHDDNIGILISDSKPVSVVVAFSLGFTGCDSYYDTSYEWIGNACIIKPEMYMYIGSNDCPDEYRIHRVAIVVSQGILPGVYQVSINNIRKEFEVKAQETDE